MSKKILVNLDLNNNSLLNTVLNPLAAAPTNAVPFYLYTSTANETKGNIYVNIGSYASPTWKTIGSVTYVNGKTGEVVLTQDDIGNGTTYVQTHNDLTDALVDLVNNALQKSGGSMTGAIDMGTNKVTNLGTPTNDNDAANKKYVDNGLALKAPLTSPTLTGTPTAPTAVTGTNTAQIATTEFVQATLSAIGSVMVFKGVVDATHGLPAEHKAGWQYKVGVTGTYAGVVCEPGDSITCIVDGTVASDADWYVTQANIDGAVTGPTSASSGHIPVFNGTSGKIIADGYAVVNAISNNSQSIPTTKAVYDAIVSNIKVSTGTITTSSTSAAVTFPGTSVINTFATMNGAEILVDVTRGSNTVTFSVATEPTAVITCTVISV